MFQICPSHSLICENELAIVHRKCDASVQKQISLLVWKGVYRDSIGDEYWLTWIVYIENVAWVGHFGYSCHMPVPVQVVEKLHDGSGRDLEQVMHEICGVENIGDHAGSFALWSSDMLTRTDQFRLATQCAIVPFLAHFILNFVYARDSPFSLYWCYRRCDIFFAKLPIPAPQALAGSGWYCRNLCWIYRCCLFTSISRLIMIHSLVKFIFETLHLKHVKHEGWRFIRVELPDSVTRALSLCCSDSVRTCKNGVSRCLQMCDDAPLARYARSKNRRSPS